MRCVLILRSPLFARREENDAVSVYYSLADSPSLLLHLFNQSELEKGNEKIRRSEGCADDVLFAISVRIEFTRVNKRVCGLVAKIIFLPTGHLFIQIH